VRARALRRWCLSLAAFFAVYFSLRTSRTAMNWLWYAVLSPLERGLGTLCGSLDVSVAEVLLLTIDDAGKILCIGKEGAK